MRLYRGANSSVAAVSGTGGGEIDWANPISVTGAVTATISKHHVCSGTTADYTVTLPAVAGNAGKLISFEMAGGLTKLVTLDGNASETIDGALTRVMWARETAVLLCDGTTWAKVGGKSIPMTSAMSMSAAQLFGAATATKLLLNTNYTAFTTQTAMQDAANNKMVCKRSGMYVLSAFIGMNNTNASATAFDARVYVGGVFSHRGSMYEPVNGNTSIFTNSATMTIASGTALELYGYFYVGSYTTSTVLAGSAILYAAEVITW